MDSALAQQGVAPRVIAVVDGQLDRTAEALRDYPRDRLRLIVNSENRGAQISRNIGLAAAETEFTMFLDSDDFVEGPLLSGLVDVMTRENSDVGFGPMQILDEARGRRRALFQPSYTSSEDLFRNWFGFARFTGSCSVLWRTAFVREIGGWDPAIQKNQDAEIVLRAILSGGRFSISSFGRGVYVNHPTPHRISTSSDMDAPLQVAEKLLALPSTAVTEPIKLEACARRFYTIARNAFAKGQFERGEQALRRSRELGFHGHQGSMAHRILSTTIGLQRRYKLTRFVRKCLFGDDS